VYTQDLGMVNVNLIVSKNNNYNGVLGWMERNGRGKKTRKIDEWIWTKVTYENEEFGCNERRDKRITNPTVD
jgi:hypothetical protein